MESSPTSEEVPMGTVVSEEAPKEDVQTVENDADDTDAPSEKKAKLDKGETAPVRKKRQSGGQRNRCDTDIIAEARAAYGELDATEGRRLRKRPEPKEAPPKKASPGKSTSQRGRKKRVVAEEVKEEDVTKEEDSKTEATENPPAEKPAADDDNAADTTEHEADVKEVAEGKMAPAETEEKKPTTTEADLSGSTEATADVSTLPAAEVCTAPAEPEAEVSMAPAEPERVEEPGTQTAEPQGLTESSAALAASE